MIDNILQNPIDFHSMIRMVDDEWKRLIYYLAHNYTQSNI